MNYNYADLNFDISKIEESILSISVNHINELISLQDNDIGGAIRFRELILRHIPQVVNYAPETIKGADILLISNEPGLTEISDLYKQFFEKLIDFYRNNLLNDKARELSLLLGNLFKQSMTSWLTLKTNTATGKINGEYKCPQKSHPMGVLGKAGYFFSENELNNDELPNDGQIISLDLFHFPQSDGSDVNPKNNKQEFPNHIDNALKLFCSSKSNKYLCLVGNRAVESQELCILQTSTNKDNGAVIFNILNKLKEQAINIRISCNFPSFTYIYRKKSILEPDWEKSTNEKIVLKKRD